MTSFYGLDVVVLLPGYAERLLAVIKELPVAHEFATLTNVRLRELYLQ